MAQGKLKYSEARRNSVSIMLSDRELAAIDEYCALFNKGSRSAVIREGAIRFVRQRIIDRQTSLFPDFDGTAPGAEAPTPYAATPTNGRGQGEDKTPSLFDFLDFDYDDDDAAD